MFFFYVFNALQLRSGFGICYYGINSFYKNCDYHSITIKSTRQNLRVIIK